VGKYSVSFTQLSPAFAVLLIAIILRDKTIIDEIKAHFHFDRSHTKWILPIIAIPSACIILSSFILTNLGVAFVTWDGNLMFYILNFFAILIGSVTEEIGWRGFLLPNLQKKHKPFVSSIIVGILWGVWHLNFNGGILGFIMYTITIVEMSILMTWVYNKSGGNLLLMTVWHLVFNLVSHIFLWGRFGLSLFIVESIVFGIMCLLLFNVKDLKI
jgi:membrane protease YdiL (CAAX protease family)